jgi:hypothetical protein
MRAAAMKNAAALVIDNGELSFRSGGDPLSLARARESGKENTLKGKNPLENPLAFSFRWVASYFSLAVSSPRRYGKQTKGVYCYSRCRSVIRIPAYINRQRSGSGARASGPFDKCPQHQGQIPTGARTVYRLPDKAQGFPKGIRSFGAPFPPFPRVTEKGPPEAGHVNKSHSWEKIHLRSKFAIFCGTVQLLSRRPRERK